MRLLIFATSLVCAAAHADFPEIFNTEPDGDKPVMSPADAAAGFQLPAGFRATPFASEPEIQNPIAMSWDTRGRLWIAENYTYAERSQRFQLDLRDRVVILDQTSKNRFDKRVVFTDNVQMLTGLEVAPDGVWLMCPPKLIFVPDRDHDDVPDGPGEVMLDGFTVAKQNYHNFANGLRFGPDGWLYGRCGGSCPGRIGVPGTPESRRLAMEGGMWRFHPASKQVEVLTSGTTNPWGHDWNEVGELFFVNTVNGHLWHMIPGAHFTRPFTLDPNRRVYQMIDFHADHWHFDTGKGWTKSRDGVANSHGGGHAHSGAMIYQGPNWPMSYRGRLLTLNFHGRRANQEILVRDGSGYVAKHGKDMLIASDPWFRGMELSAGPDGGVFVLDWSDTGECHEHTGVHRTSGRVYKITHDGAGEWFAFDPQDDLAKWTPDELANAVIQSQNAWHTRQARLVLIDRMRKEENIAVAIKKLSTAFARSPDSRVLVQTLVTLHAVGAAKREFLVAQLRHDNEHVRAWAVRLLTDRWPLDDNLGPAWKSESVVDRVRSEVKLLLPSFVRMAGQDTSSLVRLTLASTLQRLPVESRPAIARELVSHSADSDDHNLPLMIWYGLIPSADQDAEALVEVATNCRLPTTLRLIARCLAEEIEDQPGAVDQLLKHAFESADESYRVDVLTGLSDGLKGWQSAPKPKSWQLVERNRSPKTDLMVKELSALFGDGRALVELKRIALNKDDYQPETRIAALETLIQSEPDDLKSICQALLTDQKLNVIAARGLSKFSDPDIGKQLVQRYRNFRGPNRPQVISILCSRKGFAWELLGAIGKGTIPRDDLSAFQVRQIHSFGDDDLSRTVGEVWGELRESSAEKKALITATKNRLTNEILASADHKAGRRLFAKNCQNCHRLYGEGERIGPDLTGSDRGNFDYLLGNIIDPSAVVDKDFRMTILLLEDDRVINGLVTEESERTLKLQTATELLTIDKRDIVRQKVTEKSPMPDGLLESMTENQIRDLIAYLRLPNQVPLD